MLKIISDKEIKSLCELTFKTANGKINPYLICDDFRISYNPIDKYIGSNYYNRIGISFIKLKEHLKNISRNVNIPEIPNIDIQKINIIKLICHELSHSAHSHSMVKSLYTDKANQVHTDLWLYDNIEVLFSNLGYTFNKWKYIKKWLILEANNLVLIPRNINLSDYKDYMKEKDLDNLRSYDIENFIELKEDNVKLDLYATLYKEFEISVFGILKDNNSTIYISDDIKGKNKIALSNNNINPTKIYSVIRYLLSQKATLSYNKETHTLIPEFNRKDNK